MRKLLQICFCLLLPSPLFAFNPQRTDVVNGINLLYALERASLTINANVYFGAEDEETLPIAENSFYLLNENFVRILKNSKFALELPGVGTNKLMERDYLEATAKALNSDDEESGLISLLIINSISKRLIERIETNKHGIGRTKTIKPGNYYLFGVRRVEDEVLVWNLPVRVKAGPNNIEIDQHNANAVFALGK